MSIQMVLTDIGNVLITFADRKWLMEGMSRYLDCDPKEIETLYRQAGDPTMPLDVALNSGWVKISSLWTKLAALQRAKGQTVTPYHLFYSFWVGHLRPIPDVIQVFRQMQDRYPLIAVTDGNSDGWEYLRALLEDFHGLRFQRTFLSAHFGACKPALFQHVLAYLQGQSILPSQCVYVDDVHANIEAANCLGFRTIQFDAGRQPAESLTTSLRRVINI